MRVWGAGFWGRLPPPQWLDFLERHPEQRAEAPAIVEWLPDWLDKLQPITNELLTIPYVGETIDRWDIVDPTTMKPDGSFDCEDFALSVRNAAHTELGIPLGALRLAICETMTVHAVLLVCTTLGELVVDNGYIWNEIGPWDLYPCKWRLVWGVPKWARIIEPDHRAARRRLP